MPYAAACTHPFDAARLDDAFRARGLFIGDPPLEKDRERRDAGMRMKADRRHALRVDVEIIQEHERLDQLADIGRTDEPRDRPMRMPARTVGDAPGAGLRSCLRGSHCAHFDMSNPQSYRSAPHRGSLYFSIGTIAWSDRCLM